MRRWIALTAVLSGAASAAVDPYVFEELVTGADLVGVVECVDAGESIARYQVVQSWKGPAAGTLVTIWNPPEVTRGGIMVSLVGEQFVVAAFRSAETTAWTPSLHPQTLRWRRLVPDYQLPRSLERGLIEGMYRLGTERLHGWPGASVEVIRARAKELLALDRDAQQVQVIAGLFERATRYFQGPTDEDVAAIRRAASPALAMAAIFEWGRTKGRGDGIPNEVRKNLKRPRHYPPDVGEHNAVRLHQQSEGPLPEGSEREALRAAVLRPNAKGPDRFDDAFERLTRQDCAFVVAALCRPGGLAKDHMASQWAYAMGAYVAAECRDDRVTNLAMLIEKAADPWVRVAAANALALDDDPRGVPALKALQSQPGGPGALAALELARRGERESLSVAVPFLKEKRELWDSQVVTLQKRIAALLSNSAHAAGVAPPPFPPGAEWDEPAQIQRVLDWWTQHGAALQPVDPWFAELKKLRQD